MVIDKLNIELSIYRYEIIFKNSTIQNNPITSYHKLALRPSMQWSPNSPKFCGFSYLNMTDLKTAILDFLKGGIVERESGRQTCISFKERKLCLPCCFAFCIACFFAITVLRKD